MISYDVEFYKRKFTDTTMKGAYLRACKWYASNVLSKDELHNVHVRFDKELNQQFPTITIHLYAEVDESKIRNRHCEICKEIHHSFFINEANNCDMCAASGYQRRIDQEMKIKKDYYHKLIVEINAKTCKDN